MILSATIITTYLTFITWRYGWLPSISDSYYKMKNDRNKWISKLAPVIFPAVMVGFTLSIALEVGTDLMAAACGFALLTGMAAAFKEDFTKKYHFAFAFLIVACAMWSVWVDLGLWWMVVLFLVCAILIKLFFKNWLWWVEIAALIIVYIALLL